MHNLLLPQQPQQTLPTALLSTEHCLAGTYALLTSPTAILITCLKVSAPAGTWAELPGKYQSSEHEVPFREQLEGSHRMGQGESDPLPAGMGSRENTHQGVRVPGALPSSAVSTLGPALHVKAFTSQSLMVFIYKSKHAALPVRSHGCAPCDSRHQADRSMILKTCSPTSFPHPSTKGGCCHYFINKLPLT